MKFLFRIGFDLVGVREAIHSILKVSDHFDPPNDVIVDPEGDIYFYASKSFGYCFFHIIHSRERHELARLLVAHTLSNPYSFPGPSSFFENCLAVFLSRPIFPFAIMEGF